MSDPSRTLNFIKHFGNDLIQRVKERVSEFSREIERERERERKKKTELKQFT